MSLALFHPLVATWFQQQIGQPSPPQQAGWPIIARGGHTLITAPTGSGKTLAAFLVAINDLIQQGLQGSLGSGVQILYVSPLKALNNDIDRNLEVPLAGVTELFHAHGLQCPRITRAVRTGDTSTRERQAMFKHPPHILITTPESLYLLLTSAKAQQLLHGVRYLILDEVHALLDSKRGVHLALTLERLGAITDRPPQRIGLSATVSPLSEAAAFLAGGEIVDDVWRQRQVSIVAPKMSRAMDLLVQLPLDTTLAGDPPGSVWPGIYQQVLDLSRQHRSTIVFVNNRAVAERVAWHVNQLAGESIARAHHGSVSREVRLEIERQLKAGELVCLVATATLELGIDIGAVDLIIQIAAPKSVARGLQRLGRAGHSLEQVSKGRILPRTRSDLLESAIIAREMLAGSLESLQIPENCLDVLAQQVLAMASVSEWRFADLLQLVRQAYPYRQLPADELARVLAMLAGAYEQQADLPVRPRLFWDEASGLVSGDHYSRLLAICSGGTIPDRGNFPVYLADHATLLGELDEGFVFEARVGDRFMLGTAAWRIERIEQNRVIVSRTGSGGARPPYWTGEGLGRPYELGLRHGAFMRRLADRVGDADFISWLMTETPLTVPAARVVQQYLLDQRVALGGYLPNEQQLIVEHFRDEVGDCRVFLHSPLGGRVHAGLAILLQQLVAEHWQCQVEVAHDDDGILLNLLGSNVQPRGLLSLLSVDRAEELLLQLLPSTAMFSIAFRHNLARALMAGGRRQGKRSPLWIRRMRALEALQLAEQHADHPLVVETYRECLQTVLDVPALLETLRRLEQRELTVVECQTERPSPFCHGLLFQYTVVPMYEGVMAKPKAPRRVPLSQHESMRLRQQRRVASRVRQQTEVALEPTAWVKFVPVWQGVGTGATASPERLLSVIAQLSGLALPADWWEDFVFPSRMVGYRSELLDQLVVSGQVFWRIKTDGSQRLSWHLGSERLAAEIVLPESDLSAIEEQVCCVLAEKGASWLQQLATLTGLDTQALLVALEKLVWRGLVVNDSLTLLRQSPTGKPSQSVKSRARSRSVAYRPETGRFALAVPVVVPTVAEQLDLSLRRYGLFMYELLQIEQISAVWAEIYDQLDRLEMAGRLERGYYLIGPSGRQFSLPEAALELRRQSELKDTWQVLIACDPAQVAGQVKRAESELVWTRTPSTLLVSRDGQVLLVVERHGQKLSFLPGLEPEEQLAAVNRFVAAWRTKQFWGGRSKLTITSWQGQPAAQSPCVRELQQLGFWREMQDLVLWRKP